MSTQEINVKFEIIEKEELRTLFLEHVADCELKLKKAKTHNTKRHMKRMIQVFGSAAAYITELMENENTK